MNWCKSSLIEEHKAGFASMGDCTMKADSKESEVILTSQQCGGDQDKRFPPSSSFYRSSTTDDPRPPLPSLHRIYTTEKGRTKRDAATFHRGLLHAKCFTSTSELTDCWSSRFKICAPFESTYWRVAQVQIFFLQRKRQLLFLKENERNTAGECMTA